MKYKVGDRVRLVIERIFSPPYGSVGTVMAVDTDGMPYGVSWDGWTEGHDLTGDLDMDDESGLWHVGDDLELISKEDETIGDIVVDFDGLADLI